MVKEVTFRLVKQDQAARYGRLTVGNRQLTTPLLVQTGKVTATLTGPELQELGVTAVKQAALPYWLTAGEGSHPQFSDLHDRIKWSGLVVGTAGAEQAYRWAKPRGRKKDGVSFHDPQTGQQKRYTPVTALAWQDQLGCDLKTTFDRWENYYAPVDDLQAAGQQTAAWLPDQWPQGTLAAVVGGGLKRVRQASVQAAVAHSPFGYCIAGVDPDVKLAEQTRIVKIVATMLPAAGLRYLPTAGSIEQALLAIMAGMDLVDSDCAGQAAENGVALMGTKRLHLIKEHLANDSTPLVTGCQCPTCQAGYSRSYLHQLVLAHQPLATRLLLVHNLFVLNHLVTELQQAITTGQVAQWAAARSLG